MYSSPACDQRTLKQHERPVTEDLLIMIYLCSVTTKPSLKDSDDDIKREKMFIIYW